MQRAGDASSRNRAPAQFHGGAHICGHRSPGYYQVRDRNGYCPDDRQPADDVSPAELGGTPNLTGATIVPPKITRRRLRPVANERHFVIWWHRPPACSFRVAPLKPFATIRYSSYTVNRQATSPHEMLPFAKLIGVTPVPPNITPAAAGSGNAASRNRAPGQRRECPPPAGL